VWQPCFRAHQRTNNSQRRAAHRIQRTVRFDNFREALGVFGKSVSLPRQKAITQTFGWGYATVSLNTKKIKGLHENDFIMASKIDRLLDRPDGFLDHKQ
jgi:4a-hydroxytetrahydrobiopterin dehydratase